MTINYPVKLFASSYLRITHFSAFTFSSPVLLPFQDVLVQQNCKVNSHQILFYLECSLPCLFPVLNLHKSRLKTLFCDDEGCTRITADFEVNKVKFLGFGCEYCLCSWLLRTWRKADITSIQDPTHFHTDSRKSNVHF